MNTVTELPKITLNFKEGPSDKVYQCQVELAGERFVVNFQYGRRGSTLNSGTKTNVPVDLPAAQRIFEKLVREKKAKGYAEGESGTPYQHSDKQSSGIVPQLLNPIDEQQAQRLILDVAFCCQEKLDGRRMLIQKQADTITGINKKGLTTGLPMPVFNVVREFGHDVTLDGESVGDVFHCFDILHLDGVDLMGWTYRERLVTLMNLLAQIQQTVIRFVPTHYTIDQKARALVDLKLGKREGIVFKRLDAPYTPGRPNSGGSQFKFKFVATLSAVVSKINVQRSVEVRLLGEEGWQVAGNVTIPANQPVPAVGQVVEVQYLYAFPESGVLFQPVYLGPRTDVSYEECRVSQLKFKPEEEAC